MEGRGRRGDLGQSARVDLRPVASEATIAALISTTSPRAPDALEHLAANQDERAGESATDWQST